LKPIRELNNLAKIINSPQGEKVFVSWSGGKDAYLSLLMAQEVGLKVASLLSFVGADGNSRSHGLKTDLLRRQAALLGIPLETREVDWDSYEVGFEEAVNHLKREQGISGGVFGDINLVEHREWIEKMCLRCSIAYNLPLWQMEERKVSEELIKRGGKALIVAVRNDLVDQKWLGAIMDSDYIEYCLQAGISPCGEGGEAHTFVVDGPIFSEPFKYLVGKVWQQDKNSFIEIVVPG
jgi:diphthine-ammonia ligase